MPENLNISIESKSIWKSSTATPLASTLPLHLLEYGHFYAHSDYFTERSERQQYLLFYTIRGQGFLEYHGNSYILLPNTVYVIWCGDIHRYQTHTSEDWNFLWFHFAGPQASVFFDLINPGSGLSCHYPSLHFVSLLNTLISLEPVITPSQILRQNEMITNLLTELLCETIRRDQDSSPAAGKIDACIHFMESHLHEKLTLDDIAASVFLSKYYLSHLFKQQLGITPYEYLLNLRIIKVKELLVTTALPLEEIAQTAGFSDAKSLIRNFRQVMQTTPMRYRRQNSLLNL